MLVLALLAAAAAPAAAVSEMELAKPPVSAPSAPVLTDEVIRKAVRETIAEDPRPAPAALSSDAAALRATNAASARMSAAFAEAKVPDCLHDDALRLQPAHIGPVAVVGPYSLPWLVSAALRGKCR